MLLAKIRYALGDYQGALDRLDEVSLDSLPLSDISSRKMKLIGESFAIKGQCVVIYTVSISPGTPGNTVNFLELEMPPGNPRNLVEFN